MPIINGQKMACEPCIRGHRSTKCNHADERLMVPVRKPGRPLSSCPHPPGRQCNCGAVTAAIPRKQRCGCGTSSPSSEIPSVESVDNPLGEEASSPTSRGSLFRVQKTTSTKQPRTCKPSVDAVKLERTNLDQFNIMPSPDPKALSTPRNGPSPVSHHARVPSQYIPNFIGDFRQDANGFGMPVDFSTIPQYQSIPAMTTSTPELASTSSGHSTTTGSSTPDVTNGATTSSCCGGKTLSHGPSSSTANSTPSGAQTPQQVPLAMSPGILSSFYASPVPPMIPNAPTVFTYPAPYGTFLHPLQLGLWRQTMPTGQYGAETSAGIMQPIGSSMQFGQSNGVGLAGRDDGTHLSHECRCGDECNCLGCPAHPYNEATQNYVRSAVESQERWDVGNGHRNGHSHDHINGRNGHEEDANGTATGVGPEAGGSCCGGTDNGEPGRAATASPVQTPTVRTPSEPSEDSQTLSASDFLFVNYSFGSGCEGDMVSCPCGDDCQCIGCTIHNAERLPS